MNIVSPNFEGNAGTYTAAGTRERLMGLDPVATAHIAEWIVELWVGGASSVAPPLPEI